MPEYPKRESHFAHKLTRLLFKSCACQEIGSHAVLLVIHIAHTEDAVRYQYPPRFWNGQLMHLFGWNSPKQLTEARRRAVEAGWLHYEREGNRQVGRYWTLIPCSVEAFSDAPIEPCIHSENGTNSGMNSGMNYGTNRRLIHSENGTNSGTNSGKTSIPIPNPPLPLQSEVVEEGELTADVIIRLLRQDPWKLRDAKRCVYEAMQAGCRPSEIQAIAVHWKEAKKWERPQLHERIRQAMPGENPTDHWPPPKNGRH